MFLATIHCESPSITRCQISTSPPWSEVALIKNEPRIFPDSLKWLSVPHFQFLQPESILQVWSNYPFHCGKYKCCHTFSSDMPSLLYGSSSSKSGPHICIFLEISWLTCTMWVMSVFPEHFYLFWPQIWYLGQWIHQYCDKPSSVQLFCTFGKWHDVSGVPTDLDLEISFSYVDFVNLQLKPHLLSKILLLPCFPIFIRCKRFFVWDLITRPYFMVMNWESGWWYLLLYVA